MDQLSIFYDEATETGRNYRVVKSNELIQKTRFSLTAYEQKIIFYLISKIKPGDTEFKEQIFSIVEFCKICGLYKDSGANYAHIKKTLKALRDKSVWVDLGNGKATTMSWIERVTIDTENGEINVIFDKMMKPYLLQLQTHFTQWELYYTLGMKSQYSIRLYEILKSYQFKTEKNFDIELLKEQIDAKKYERFADFRRFVIETAMREINELTDINCTYNCSKTGKKYTDITFNIEGKINPLERVAALASTEKVIRGRKRKKQ